MDSYGALLPNINKNCRVIAVGLWMMRVLLAQVSIGTHAGAPY